MSQKFSNAARSALMANISAGDTSLLVDITKADLFPVADTGTDPVPTIGKDWFKIVLEDSSHNIEIVYVRTRTLGSASMTNLLRGQEGTTARSYLAGSIVGLRHTAIDLADAVSFASGASSFWRTLVGWTTGALSRAALGATAVGDALFTAVDAAAAQAAIGATAIGEALITAVSAAAARLALGVAPRATRIDVASVAGTVDLTTNAPDTDDIRITGALAITAFTVAVGRVIRVTAGGAFSLANNASIVTQIGGTLQLAAGDTLMLRATAANVVEVLSYVPKRIANVSGQILKIQSYTDSGASTVSTTMVALAAGYMSYTPVSTASKLFIFLTGQCFATAYGVGAGFCYFWICENTGSLVPVSTAIALQSQQYSTTYGQQIYAPLAIQYAIVNSSLATRLFCLGGASWNAAVTAGGSAQITIIEVAN